MHDDVVAGHLHDDTVEPAVHVPGPAPPLGGVHPHVLDSEPGRQQNDQGLLAARSAKCLNNILYLSLQIPYLEAEQGQEPGLQVTPTTEEVAKYLALEADLGAVSFQQVWDTVPQAW